MKTWLLRIAVILSALAVLAVGGWWAWRAWSSGEQFRAAVKEGIDTGDFSRAEQFKAWGADIQPWQRLDAGEQLLTAISLGKLLEAKYLLTLGANTDTRNKYGSTALHTCSARGYVVLFPFLMDAGADVNEKSVDDFTPLHYAITHHRVEVVRELLRLGAEVTHADKSGYTPLHLAADKKQEDIVRLLVNNGANARASSRYGTPIDLWPKVEEIIRETKHLANNQAASRIESSQISEADLVQASLDAQLHVALREGREDDAVRLIQSGANPNYVGLNDPGDRPLHWAVCFYYYKLHRALIAHGADLSARNNEGHTPLHSAAQVSAYEAARILIAAGADVNVLDKQGRTPLDLAGTAIYRPEQCENLVILLVESGGKGTAPQRNAQPQGSAPQNPPDG